MGGSPKRALKAVATGGLSEITKVGEKIGTETKRLGDWTSSDTVRSLTGRKTSEEKAAEEEQKISMLTAKKEADDALALRKARMEKKAQGRASLLSGSELGLQSTLG